MALESCSLGALRFLSLLPASLWQMAHSRRRCLRKQEAQSLDLLRGVVVEGGRYHSPMRTSHHFAAWVYPVDVSHDE